MNASSAARVCLSTMCFFFSPRDLTVFIYFFPATLSSTIDDNPLLPSLSFSSLFFYFCLSCSLTAGFSATARQRALSAFTFLRGDSQSVVASDGISEKYSAISGVVGLWRSGSACGMLASLVTPIYVVRNLLNRIFRYCFVPNSRL